MLSFIAQLLDEAKYSGGYNTINRPPRNKMAQFYVDQTRDKAMMENMLKKPLSSFGVQITPNIDPHIFENIQKNPQQRGFTIGTFGSFAKKLDQDAYFKKATREAIDTLQTNPQVPRAKQFIFDPQTNKSYIVKIKRVEGNDKQFIWSLETFMNKEMNFDDGDDDRDFFGAHYAKIVLGQSADTIVKSPRTYVPRGETTRPTTRLGKIPESSTHNNKYTLAEYLRLEKDKKKKKKHVEEPEEHAKWIPQAEAGKMVQNIINRATVGD